jgi:hypothetical protein
VLLSFAAFASDQAGEGSKATVAKIATANASEQITPVAHLDSPSPSGSTERVREKEHSSLREKLDDANDALVTPFKGAAESQDSIWSQRLVAGLLALLTFGVGLHYVARLVALRGI